LESKVLTLSVQVKAEPVQHIGPSNITSRVAALPPPEQEKWLARAEQGKTTSWRRKFWETVAGGPPETTAE
jgi:hypothetical protein